MTVPLTDQQLAAMARDVADLTEGPWLVADAENGRPLVYVERPQADGQVRAFPLFTADAATEADIQFAARARERVPALLAEVQRLRAELEQARAAALNEGADHLDRIADQAEAKVLEYYNGTCGHGSCDMVREGARSLRDLATPASCCGAEPGRQTGCAGGER